MTHTFDATELFERTETALAITELPEFDSTDSPEQREQLVFVPTDEQGLPTWALQLRDEPDDFVPVDTDMTRHLLEAHFREWLLHRGYQVQVHIHLGLQRWTLADCLSAADGGGDRLDVDYPYGDDPLDVLVNSVIAVNTL